MAFALLLLGTIFLLRIFYAGYVWADEGLWFTTAQELLRGKALYSEIWFDKPPGVAWIYAALFAPAGPSLLAVRLFTIFYATLVALALWHMGRRFWGDEEGRLAALLYALYNATYLHSQVQPLAVDHLLLLPYLYAGFFFLYGRSFWSGLLVAVAFWLNPKALVLWSFFRRRRIAASEVPHSCWRPGWTAAPVGVVAGRVSGRMRAVGGLLAGGRQVGRLPAGVLGLGMELRHRVLAGDWGADRPAQDAELRRFSLRSVSGAGAAAGVFPARQGHSGARSLPRCLALAGSFLPGGGHWRAIFFRATFTRCCRFFACLPRAATASRGRLASGCRKRRVCGINAALRVLFWAGIVFALVWFHNRTAARAYELVTGRSTTYMATWNDPAIDRDSRRIARRLQWEEERKGAAEGSAARPAANPGQGPSLFVWGYRPEIYFYCGCPPASKFLSSQPLTGVPADIHLVQSRSVAPQRAAENRRRLLRELQASRPDYIVDGLGLYNTELAIGNVSRVGRLP